MKKTQSIYYKISINLGPICFLDNTKVYEIEEGKSRVVPGIKYSILTILFGWWGWRFSFKRPFQSFNASLIALRTNFAGGEDLSQFISDQNYDNRTNHIWNNLYPKTTEIVEKDNLEIILEIQDKYVTNNPDQMYAKDNLNFIKITCGKLNMNELGDEEITDIFEAMESYDRSLLDN